MSFSELNTFHPLNPSPNSLNWCASCHRTFPQNSLTSQQNCPECQFPLQQFHHESIPNSNSSESHQQDQEHEHEHEQEQDQHEHSDSQEDHLPSGHSILETDHPDDDNDETPDPARSLRLVNWLLFFFEPLFAANDQVDLIIESESGHIIITRTRLGGGLNNDSGAPPASKEDLDKLEEFPYVGKEAEESCPICYESYKEQDTMVKLGCAHDYHKVCVREWLSKHNACPMCRQAI